MTNQDALRELKTVLLRFCFDRQEKAAIQLGISALEEWCRNPDPPPNSVPVRIAFTQDADGNRAIQEVLDDDNDAIQCCLDQDLTRGPTITGIITAHLPRPQAVEVKAASVEVRET
jgi:hypothetical protein